MAPGAEIEQRNRIPWGTLAPLVVIILAMFPLLSVHAWQLWSRPHYQYFPVVLGICAMLVASRWPSEGWSCESAGLALIARGCYLLSIALFAVATAKISPLLCWGATIALTAGMLIHGKLPLWGPWILLLLVLRLPNGLDERLIQWLQQVTTQLSSIALDVMGVEHNTEGNVIHLPDEPMLIAEACSGVVSLLTLVSTGVVVAVWMRRSFWHGTLLAASGVIWAGTMNIFRICAVVAARSWYDYDLLADTPHTILGILTFLLGAALLLSTDRLLLFVFGTIPVDPISELHEQVEGNPLVGIWNRVNPAASIPEETVGDSNLTPQADRGIGWKLVDWSLACVALALAGASMYAGIGPFHVTSHIPEVVLTLNEDYLPAELGSWSRTGFEVIDRGTNSDFGEYSRKWTYRSGSYQLTIELDYPFQEWHELSVCYVSEGWQNEGRRTFGGTAREVELAKTSSERAVLFFDLCQTDGSPFEVPKGDFLHPTWRRVLAGGNRWTMPTYLQMQAFLVAVDGEVPDEVREEARQAFEMFRQQVIETLKK